MSTVSNTSPIINLAQIGQMDLLHQLYGEILIPEAVYSEIAVAGVNKPGSIEVQTVDWITTRTVIDRQFVAKLLRRLDPGEAEAIALTVEAGATLLILDERLGRLEADHLGLKYIGLLGVLLEAKHIGLIEAVKEPLDRLISIGFRVARNTYNQLLKTTREGSK